MPHKLSGGGGAPSKGVIGTLGGGGETFAKGRGGQGKRFFLDAKKLFRRTKKNNLKENTKHPKFNTKHLKKNVESDCNCRDKGNGGGGA